MGNYSSASATSYLAAHSNSLLIGRIENARSHEELSGKLGARYLGSLPDVTCAGRRYAELDIFEHPRFSMTPGDETFFCFERRGENGALNYVGVLLNDEERPSTDADGTRKPDRTGYDDGRRSGLLQQRK